MSSRPVPRSRKVLGLNFERIGVNVGRDAMERSMLAPPTRCVDPKRTQRVVPSGPRGDQGAQDALGPEDEGPCLAGRPQLPDSNGEAATRRQTPTAVLNDDRTHSPHFDTHRIVLPLEDDNDNDNDNDNELVGARPRASGGAETRLAEKMGGVSLTRDQRASGVRSTRSQRDTPPAADPLLGKDVWYLEEGQYFQGTVQSRHEDAFDATKTWYKASTADGRHTKILFPGTRMATQPPVSTCPPQAWGKLRRTDLTVDAEACEVDYQENLNRWTPSPSERQTFFKTRFEGGGYEATVPGAAEALVEITLTGAFVRGKHVVFTYRDAAGAVGGIEPAQLLFPASEVRGRKLRLPAVAAEPWADERAAFFATLAKKAHRKGRTHVVLDGRGRNTLALRKAGLPSKALFNVEMDPELACWQRLHGMHSIYSNAYVVKKHDPGLIENSILFQDRHPYLQKLYQNTAAVYFDYYGCKHKLFDDVMAQSEKLLPKATVIGIAQFTQMAACRRLVQEPLAIDSMPQWRRVFDKTKRSMRCRFYVKRR